MTKVELIKIDESYSQIVCERAQMYELSDELTFKVDGAHWSPAFRNGFWDGKIRLLNKNGQLYTGLADFVKNFCKQRNYKFSGLGFAEEKEINPDKLMKNIMSWNPTRYDDNQKRVPLKPHKEQMMAIYAALLKKRLIVESATAAGKSFIVCTLTRILSRNKTLIIVPRVDLANQMLENYHEYFENWDPTIDLLYSGQKLTGADILIGTWQSLAKRPKSFFEQFKTVIYDEVHEAESKSACKILESCTNAEFRIGLTGTLKDAKTHQLTLQGLFGKNYKFSRAIDNINKGVSAKLDILVQKLNYDVPLQGKFETGSEKYMAELEYIWLHKARNAHIYNTANKLKGTTLVLFKNTAHGELMYKEYREKYGDKNIFIIHGGIDKEKRKKIRQYIMAHPEDDILLFASLGTFSTGINIKTIKAAILAGPLKDKIKLLQSIGRGLRVTNDGAGFLFIDLVDIIPNANILKKHGIERVNRYIEEEFSYKVEQIKL